ncbi:hypothetical protein AB2C39_33540, partial [Pseudomonas aeruginosa]
STSATSSCGAAWASSSRLPKARFSVRVFGAAATVMSAPATLTLAALGVAAGVGHALVTYNPDYEIIKDYVNKRLRVIYKK